MKRRKKNIGEIRGEDGEYTEQETEDRKNSDIM